MSDYMLLNTVYGLVIETSKAAKIMELLKDSLVIKDAYSNEKIKLEKDTQIRFESFSSQKREDILKAQFMDLTYEQYLETKRVSKQNISGNQTIPDDSEK